VHYCLHFVDDIDTTCARLKGNMDMDVKLNKKACDYGFNEKNHELEITTYVSNLPLFLVFLESWLWLWIFAVREGIPTTLELGELGVGGYKPWLIKMFGSIEECTYGVDIGDAF